MKNIEQPMELKQELDLLRPLKEADELGIIKIQARLELSFKNN